MSSAVNLMMAVDVEGWVGAIRRRRVKVFVALFAPSLADEVTGWSVCDFVCRRRRIDVDWLRKYLR